MTGAGRRVTQRALLTKTILWWAGDRRHLECHQFSRCKGRRYLTDQAMDSVELVDGGGSSSMPRS